MEIGDIDGLEDRLDEKANVVHPHATSDITGLVEILAEKEVIGHTHDLSDFPDIFDNIGQNFAPSVHQHTIEQVTGLQGALNAKSNTGHGHSIAQVTGLQTALDGKTSTGHGHEISDVTGLQAALNEKTKLGHHHEIAAITDLQTTLDNKATADHEHEISDIDGLAAVLAANGNVQSDWTEGNNQNAAFIKNKPTLGTAAVRNVGTGANDVAAGNHTHSAADIVSGTIDLARLPLPLPGTVTIVSSGTLSDLTNEQVALIATGTTVVTSDGTRYVYSSTQEALIITGLQNESAVLNGTYVKGADVEGKSAYYNGLNKVAWGNSPPRYGLYQGSTLKYATHSPDPRTGWQPAVDSFPPNPSVNLIGDKREPASYVVTSTSTVNYSNLEGAPGFASTLEGGLMSSADKFKLNGIAAEANKYIHPSNDGDLHVPATGTANNGKVLMAGDAAKTFSWKSVAISDVTGLQSALSGKSGTEHVHGNIKADGSIGSVSGKIVVTGTNGVLTVGSDAATAPTHTHGQITNDGKVGGDSNRVLVTGTAGVVQALGTGTSGQVLSLSSGGVPTWTTPTGYTHPTGDGNLHVPATGTTNNGKVLTAGATAGSATWQTPAVPTSVANISGGTAGQLLFQSGVGTTSKIASGTTGQFLRSGGATPAGPSWATLGAIAFKAADEYVAADTNKSVLKIQKMTPAEYQALGTKEATTLYIIV